MTRAAPVSRVGRGRCGWSCRGLIRCERSSISPTCISAASIARLVAAAADRTIEAISRRSSWPCPAISRSARAGDQFAEARAFLESLPFPKLVVPGQSRRAALQPRRARFLDPLGGYAGIIAAGSRAGFRERRDRGDGIEQRARADRSRRRPAQRGPGRARRGAAARRRPDPRSRSSSRTIRSICPTTHGAEHLVGRADMAMQRLRRRRRRRVPRRAPARQPRRPLGASATRSPGHSRARRPGRARCRRAAGRAELVQRAAPESSRHHRRPPHVGRDAAAVRRRAGTKISPWRTRLGGVPSPQSRAAAPHHRPGSAFRYWMNPDRSATRS